VSQIDTDYKYLLILKLRRVKPGKIEDFPALVQKNRLLFFENQSAPPLAGKPTTQTADKSVSPHLQRASVKKYYHTLAYSLTGSSVPCL
jgi:hypothetical protein